MISLDAQKSRRSPIGEVLRQVVHGCSSRRTMCHHRSPPFAACESKRTGSDKPNAMCLSTKDAISIGGCNLGFHAGKRSERKVSLPLCSLTIWYYCNALTLCIAKPDPAYTWHLERNMSLGTTTRNQPKSIRIHLPSFNVQDMVRSGLAGVVKVGKVMLGTPMLNSPALAYSLAIYSLITFIVLVKSSVLVQVLLISYTCYFSSWHVPWNLICTMCA